MTKAGNRKRQRSTPNAQLVRDHMPTHDDGSQVITFRPLVAADQERLWDWLHIALWDPPPAELRSKEILTNPHVRIYAENWDAPTDVGVVAQVDGQDAGACWMRLLPWGVGL